ncbi:MAG: AbrB/MazE/SpoVT family DNA-binding domain-containing protein [Rhodocyclaceae bacterium]|nr:AbrB/MazE/SpoVT family DNA-binding domain-containing protein [Rhodocyclaceae bacterium]
MSFTMTVTARGQFTLNKQWLKHLGIRPGEKVSVSMEPDRTIRIAPAARKLSLDEVLARIGKYDVGSASVDEINRLVAEGYSGSGKEAGK